MISKRIGVSIFFPCYNDSRSIGKLVQTAFSIIKQYTNKYEVIVIDDNSTDSSKMVLQSLANEYDKNSSLKNKLKLIFHKDNLGYGGALRSGFKAAKYELIFYTDGDGQYDVSELPILLSLMSKDVDFINGIKMSRHDPTYRIVVGNLYSFFTRWLFWTPIADIDCDFRLIRKRVVKKLKLKCNSGAICIELVKKSQIAGAKFRQVSIHHLNRKFGTSQFFRVNRILSTIQEVILLWLELVVIRRIEKIKFALRFRQYPVYNTSHAN